jgi:hypothetical protein
MHAFGNLLSCDPEFREFVTDRCGELKLPSPEEQRALVKEYLSSTFVGGIQKRLHLGVSGA